MRKGFRIALAISMLLGATQVFGWNEGMWDQFALALKKLKYSIIPQTTNTVTLGDSTHKFLSADITTLNSTNYIVADDGYVGLGASAGRFVFDSTATPDTITALAADLILGSASTGQSLKIHDAGSVTLYEDGDNFSASMQCKDGAAQLQLNDDLDVGADDAGENVYIHSGGNLTLYDASDDTSVNIAVGNGTTVATLTGSLTVSDDAIVTDLLSFDEADWTGGNVIYVPLTGSIEAYHDAATAGDTLVLASGTYTITDDIDVTKAINIVGQGKWTGTSGTGTLINCATASKNAFDISVSNVRIANLSITNSGGTGYGIKTANGNSSGLVLKNIDITVSGAGTNVGILCYSYDATIRDCVVSVVSSDGIAQGISCYNDSSSTGSHIVNIYNSYFSTDGSGSEGSNSFISYNNNNAASITLNLYDCYGIALSGGTIDAAIRCTSLSTNNAAVNVYGGSFSGADYDVLQTGTNTLTLHNVELVNNTTSGTITYAGSVASTRYVSTGGVVRTVTDTANVNTTDTVLICNKSTAFTVTLPASAGTGKVIYIKNIGAGTVTIARAGSDVIDGATSKDLLQWESIGLVDGSSGYWYIL